MKQLFSLLLLFIAYVAPAQIAINTDGSNPDANAMLDVKSATKGVKFPRLTTAQRKAIGTTTADAGLFVYDTDKQALYMFDGANWKAFATIDPTVPVVNTMQSPQLSYASRLGAATAIKGDWAVATATTDTVNGQAARGSAIVYHRVGGVWAESTKLTASDGTAYQYFGNTVAITDDFIAIGSSSATIGGIYEAGAVYIYKRTGNSWAQIDKLTGPVQNARFGTEVAMEGNTLVIGATQEKVGTKYTGAAYVYKYNGTSWALSQKLLPPNGEDGDEFGRSVSLQGTWLAVGAPYDDVGATADLGTVYVFVLVNNNYLLNQQLAPTSLAAHNFGYEVAIITDQVAIATKFTDNTAAVYVHKRTGGNTWVMSQMLSHPDLNLSFGITYFGSHLKFMNNTLLISSPSDQGQGLPNQGSLYKFDFIEDNFKLTRRIAAPGNLYASFFANAFDYDGTSFIIGASGAATVSFGSFGN